MKQLYFTSQTLEQKAWKMRQSLEKFQRPREWQLEPSRSALLVLDMQDYFLDATSHAFIPSAGAILPGVKALIQAYAQNGLPVVFTQHINDRQDAGLMATWWRDLITPQSPYKDITVELDTSTGIVIQKSQYDAFYKTPLEHLLRDRGVSQVLITGVMTNLCCETTARSAFVRGFEVLFLIDGTATYNEDFHQATLVNLSHGFAVPVLCKEILSALKKMT